MLRGTAPRSALIVGVLALLGSLVLGSRLFSSTAEPEGLPDDVLQVEMKLRPSAGTRASGVDTSPYQPPVQARESSAEEPHEAPGHRPIPSATADTTASQRSAEWGSTSEDGDSRGDRDQENDDD